MTTKLDDLLPTAKDFMKKLARAEADQAAKAARQHETAEAEKRKLLEQFEKPSGLSDEERIKRAVVVIERDRKTEVQIIPVPSDLCTDHGRAVNQPEQGWESALTGALKNSIKPGRKCFRLRRYKSRAGMVDFLATGRAMSA
jgi:hypothetical protein